MDITEAIVLLMRLKKQMWNIMPLTMEYEIKAVNKGIEALEKQIPKKPAIYKDTRDLFDLNGNVTGTYETDVIECPFCGEYLLDLAAYTEYQEILNYCNRCGQALEFSEVQENENEKKRTD